MRRHLALHRFQSKPLSLLIPLIFFVNTLSYADVSPCTLQAPSKFKPIPNVAENDYRTQLDIIRGIVGHDCTAQLDIETALILAMSMEEATKPPHDINARLDQMYAGSEKNRLLDVVKIGRDHNGKTILSLRIFSGLRRGYRFDIVSSCKSIADIQTDESKEEVGSRGIEAVRPKTGPQTDDQSSDILTTPTEKYIESFDGARICYKVIGDGPVTMTLLHYWGGDKEKWHRLIEVMQNNSFFKDKFRFVLIDLRGFGKSELKGRDWKSRRNEIKKLFGTRHLRPRDYIRYCAKDIRSVLSHLGVDDGMRVDIMGHSLGGMVTAQFAIDFPEIVVENLALIHSSVDPIATFFLMGLIPFSGTAAKLGIRSIGWTLEETEVLIDSFFGEETNKDLWWRINRIKNTTINAVGNSEFLWRIAKIIVMNGRDGGVVDQVLRGVGRANAESILYALIAMSHLKFSKKQLRSIPARVLVVCGDGDWVVGANPRWARFLNPDLCTVAKIKDCKHMSTLEDPSELCELLKEFYGKRAEFSPKASSPLCGRAETADGKEAEALETRRKDAERKIEGLENNIYDARSICGRDNNLVAGLALIMARLDYKAVNRPIEGVSAAEIENVSRKFYQGLLGAKDNGVYIAVKDGEVIGFLQYSFQTQEGKRPVLMGKLAVRDTARKGGIAKQLLDAGINTFIEEYPYSDEFDLCLAKGDRDHSELEYFKSRYFPERAKEKDTGLPWYLEWRRPKNFSSNATFIVTIHETRRRIENLISHANRKSGHIFRHRKVQELLSPAVGEKGTKKQDAAVNIIITPSIISSADIDNDIKVLARLMLLCKDLNKVNLIIAKTMYGDRRIKGQKVPANRLASLLRSEIIDQAKGLGMDPKNARQVADRVKYRRNGHDEKDRSAVEIPFISKDFAQWIRDNGVELDENHYPVVLQGTSSRSTTSKILNNYQAAWSIALAKASLVLAKRSMDKPGASPESATSAREEYRTLKNELLQRLNSLYEVVKKDTVLTSETLDFLIDSRSVHRLNRAIELYIPYIIRHAVDELLYFHEKILFYLHFA